MNPALYSGKTDEWATPQALFDELDAEFHFTLDPCANSVNHKCAAYYTKEQDGLAQDWGGHVVFCNPPYGRQIKDWVRNASNESQKLDTIIIMLIPARTDTTYFHDFIYNKAEIRFIRGRITFVGDKHYPAPFPSMIVVFKIWLHNRRQ